MSQRHWGPLPLQVRTITRAEHAAWVKSRSRVSFLQTPEWADVKREWRGESVGWFAADELVGAGLVLYRSAPIIKRSLAYLPEGPDIDWTDGDIARWLRPLVAHAKSQGAFTLKIGAPVISRVWRNETIKQAIGSAQRLGDVPADYTSVAADLLKQQLRKAGWRQQEVAAGFGDVQPRYVFTVEIAGRSDEELLESFNQLWRRNLKKAEKCGVLVRQGERADLARFHSAYLETAKRDQFTPRPLGYFERYWDAFAVVPGRLRLYLAEVDGEVAAATLWVRVGTHAWYAYGASTTQHRDARPSNAIQWQMLRDARDAGATTYDLRGISDTLDEADPLFGLIRFKLGIGGQAVEYVGEHDYAINRLLATAFSLYLRRR